ncbi:MAG: hypothetical protein D6729_04980 [Deltaproteobacteria bacterium]|nr:MAG: hypothetical protein D6729_04980 [Deltaproteobacteria bacterium]
MRRVRQTWLLLGLTIVGLFGLGTAACGGRKGGDGGGGGGGGTSGVIGDACQSGDDCAEGLACHAGLPGGYCIAQCWDGCPDGSTCTRFAGQDWCLRTCADDSECREGYVCRSGTCQPPCASDRDCPGGLSCQNGACVEGGIGAACASPSDCAPGLSCAPSLPGGYCTRSCVDEPCPTGTSCVTFGGSSYCFDGCLTNSDCRSGYVCSGGICDEACSSDAECGGGELCINSACVGSGVGQSCSLGSDCPGGLSCYKGGGDGYCTQSCTSGADCPTGSTCGNLQGNRMCVAACRADVDCGRGQRCTGGACVFPCTSDSQCPDGYCDTASGQCRGAISGGGNMKVIDLGTISPGGTYTIPVDAQTFAFTVEVVGSTGSMYLISSVRRPDGTELVSSYNPFEGPMRVSPGEGYGAVTVPNADDSRLAMTPGNWTFSYMSDYGRSARGLIFLKKSSNGRPVGGTIPLHVYLAPNAIPGVSAATAATNSHVQQAIARVRFYYRDQAGIDFSNIQYGDVSSTYTDIRSDSDYKQMFESYGQDDELSVFLVRSITIQGQSGVAGVAGGIPGPARSGGTRSSGVVIEVQNYARMTGDDMAHEMGHFQGLYHTTESDGRTQDRLSDTPECSDLYRCQQGWYQLMFPFLSGQQDTLSPASVAVVQGNATSD